MIKVKFWIDFVAWLTLTITALWALGLAAFSYVRFVIEDPKQIAWALVVFSFLWVAFRER